MVGNRVRRLARVTALLAVAGCVLPACRESSSETAHRAPDAVRTTAVQVDTMIAATNAAPALGRVPVQGARAESHAAAHSRRSSGRPEAPAPRPAAARTTVSFSSPFVDPGTHISGLEKCEPTQAGVCSFTFHGDSGRFTGALSTVADYHGHGYYDPIAMTVRGESWDHHVGSLSGCGAGSFVMHQTNLQAGPMTIDPAQRAMRLTLEWQIVEGSGTGAFAGATGSGNGIAYVNSVGFADNEPYLPNAGTYSGTIKCPAGRQQ